MLELKDFHLLPQMEALVKRIMAGGPGLGLVAGLEPGSLAGPGVFPASGRSALLRILIRQSLQENAGMSAIVVGLTAEAARFPLSLPRALENRVRFRKVHSPEAYAEAITGAARRRPGLLVVDRLCEANASAALRSAGDGLWVMSQL